MIELLEEKLFTNHNTLTILRITSLLIKIKKLNNYNKVEITDYQQLIRKGILLNNE